LAQAAIALHIGDKKIDANRLSVLTISQGNHGTASEQTIGLTQHRAIQRVQHLRNELMMQAFEWLKCHATLP